MWNSTLGSYLQVSLTCKTWVALHFTSSKQLKLYNSEDDVTSLCSLSSVVLINVLSTNAGSI